MVVQYAVWYPVRFRKKSEFVVGDVSTGKVFLLAHSNVLREICVLPKNEMPFKSDVLFSVDIK